MTDLGRRIASAALLGPLVLLVVWWGNPAFALLAATMAALIVWEWNGITRRRRNDPAMIVAVAGAGLAVLAAAADFWLVAALGIGAGAFIGQFLARRADEDGVLWLGVFYAALPAIALVVLRDDPQWGLVVVLWLLFLVWATDIAAFFAGRYFAGPKLWPSISPKKTWSGALGGVAAAVVLGLLFVYFLLPSLEAPWILIGIIVFLSVAAQSGDLAESALKRRYDVKDSSNLIPGHGGIMDRVDGLVAAALAAGLLGVVRAGPGAAGEGVLLW